MLSRLHSPRLEKEENSAQAKADSSEEGKGGKALKKILIMCLSYQILALGVCLGPTYQPGYSGGALEMPLPRLQTRTALRMRPDPAEPSGGSRDRVPCGSLQSQPEHLCTSPSNTTRVQSLRAFPPSAQHGLSKFQPRTLPRPWEVGAMNEHPGPRAGVKGSGCRGTNLSWPRLTREKPRCACAGSARAGAPKGARPKRSKGRVHGPLLDARPEGAQEARAQWLGSGVNQGA